MPSIARAKARIHCSLTSGGMAGSPLTTALPPPWGSPAALFFIVMARARRNASSTVTSGAMRMPPMAGPLATLSTTSTAFIPNAGS